VILVFVRRRATGACGPGVATFGRRFDLQHTLRVAGRLARDLRRPWGVRLPRVDSHRHERAVLLVGFADALSVRGIRHPVNRGRTGPPAGAAEATADLLPFFDADSVSHPKLL